VAPRIVIIGGGSYQWVPKLLVDVAKRFHDRDAATLLA
jgi:alpha-galactosidase/6-phospho-beta-glucosidase family protein